jgi:hypothetical protein
LGVFAKYQKNDIYQGSSKAHIDNIGGGFYFGAMLNERLEVRTLIEGMRNNIDSERIIDYDSKWLLDKKAVSEFSSVAFGADVEFSLKKIGVTNMSFRPYLGAQIKHVNYGNFTEEKAKPLVLEVADGSYERTVARIGGELKYGDENHFSWYGIAELKYIVSGRLPSVKVRVAGSDTDFYSVGFEESEFVPGVGFGMSFNLFKGLRLYAEGNYFGAKNSEYYKADVGLKYGFGLLKEQRTKVEVNEEDELIKVFEVQEVNIPKTEEEPEPQQKQENQKPAPKTAEEEIRCEEIKAKLDAIVNSSSSNSQKNNSDKTENIQPQAEQSSQTPVKAKEIYTELTTLELQKFDTPEQEPEKTKEIYTEIKTIELQTVDPNDRPSEPSKKEQPQLKTSAEKERKPIKFIELEPEEIKMREAAQLESPAKN